MASATNIFGLNPEAYQRFQAGLAQNQSQEKEFQPPDQQQQPFAQSNQIPFRGRGKQVQMPGALRGGGFHRMGKRNAR